MSADTEFADWISDLNDLYVSASHGEIWAKVKEFRAMVAHEQAEKQREKRKDWEVRAFNGGYDALNAVDALIDLIDPEKPDA